MATLSSPGIGSGLDVNSIVSQLMNLERQPERDLDTQISSYQAKISAFGSLTNYLSSLQSAAQSWKQGLSMEATSGDTSVFTATASTGAEVGNYSVQVTHLADYNKVTSSAYSTNDTIAAGTLTIDLGTFDDHGATAANRVGNWTFASKQSISVNFNGGSILQLRDAINKQAGSLVSAQVITAADGMHLSIMGKNKGMDNALTITGSGNAGTLTDLAAFSYDITNPSNNTNVTEVSVPWSTEATIDGLKVRSNTNMITNALRGVTINVLKTSDPNTTTSLTVGTDTQAITDRINGFIKAYNALKINLKTQTAYDATTKTASPLTGDSTARSVNSQLNAALTTVPAALSNNTFKRFFEIGIKLRDDGNLELQPDKLAQALDKDPQAVMSMLNAYGAEINKVVNGLTGSKGVITTRTDGINDYIKGLNDRKNAIEDRMTIVEANYRKQFNALDSAMASMQSTTTALTQQLAGLARFAQ